MDWGIIVSVLAAMVLFILGIMVICVPACLLVMRRMRKTMRAGGASMCSMAGCCSSENIEGATQS